MNPMKHALTICIVCSAACGPDSEGKSTTHEISQSLLAGAIAGEAFEFKSGWAADVFGDGEYWVELHGTEVEDPCASRQFPDGPFIILSVLPEPSDANLTLQHNITFAHGDAENDVATTGRLVIDGVAEGTLSGGLYATMREHEVDGTFSVPVCSE